MNYFKTYEEFIQEDIKGWKHAQSDLMKIRSDIRNAKKSIKLVSLKKDGTPSKLQDAIKFFKNEDELNIYLQRLKEFNKGKIFYFELYVDNEFKGKISSEEIINNE